MSNSPLLVEMRYILGKVFPKPFRSRCSENMRTLSALHANLVNKSAIFVHRFGFIVDLVNKKGVFVHKTLEHSEGGRWPERISPIFLSGGRCLFEIFGHKNNTFDRVLFRNTSY